MAKKTVGSLLQNRPPICVEPTTPLVDACRVLAEHRIGALPVVEGGALIGILSERDVIARAIAKGRDPKILTVAAVMTAKPVTISPAASTAEAFLTMKSGGFRHLPVVDGSRLVGVVSSRDLPTARQIFG